jgi:DNA processing protein
VVDAVTITGAERRAEAEALLALDGAPRIGPARLWSLIGHFGSARAALASGAAGGADVTTATRHRAARALQEAEAHGMHVLLHTDAGYPPRLRHLADPPPLLFLRGDPALLVTTGVAIVGSRRATARGRSVARKLGAAVAREGVPVVSGMALGVDGEAHRGALDVSGPTIAVLGRGADAPYPPAHRGLFRDILREGLAVSEFPPGTPALPHHFPRRNRILAALARAVVVVEAGEKSGALITVEHALDLGLDVFAVPGPIDLPACRGSNGLLADGAQPLVSVTDFVRDELGVASTEVRDDGAAGPSVAANGEEARVLACLERGTASVDHVASAVGLDVPSTLTVLSRLELRGSVERVAGMRFRRAG